MQSQEQRNPIQPQKECNAYRTPKLARYGKLASLVEGGSTSSLVEVTVVFSNNL